MLELVVDSFIRVVGNLELQGQPDALVHYDPHSVQEHCTQGQSSITLANICSRHDNSSANTFMYWHDHSISPFLLYREN